jgi:hypothetical protein
VLHAGNRPDKGMLGKHAQIVRDTKTGTVAFMRSTAPLSVSRADGSREPVDLGLHGAGAFFEPGVAEVPIRIARDATGGVRFPTAEFTVSPVVAKHASDSADADRVFWANVLTDTDYAVRPQPTGAESYFHLRSKESPETLRLKVEMPPGARLEHATTDHTIPDDPPTSIAIVRGKDTLGYVGAAQTTDAEDTVVPTTTEIHGDEIVIRVSHRQSKFLYPLLTDPQYWTRSSACTPVADGTTVSNSLGGWYWQQYVRAGVYSFGAANCVTTPAPAYGPGLYTSMPTNSWFTYGDYARYVFQAPPRTYIYDTMFGNLSHNAPFYSRFHSGLANPQLSAWFSDVTLFNPGNGLTVANPVTFDGAFAAQNLDACFTPRCTDQRGPGGAYEGGYAIFGIIALAPNNNVIFTGTNNPNVLMGHANVMLGDAYAPAFASAPPANVGWIDDNGAAHTRTASMGDVGLGAYTITLSGAIGGPQRREAPCSFNPQPATAPCPTSPTNFSWNFSYTLSEGANDLYFWGNDIIDNRTPLQLWTERIDRSAPTISASGTLYDARGGYVGVDTDLTLQVRAEDGATSPAGAQRSGVASLEVTLDGQALPGGSPTQACTAPEGSCPLTAPLTLTAAQLQALKPGVHTIAMRAVDALGHPTIAGGANSFTFMVDDVAPTTFADGSLEQLSGRTLTENSYRLRVEARDNQPFAPEIDDEADSEEPAFDTPGVGLLNLVIRLDGQTLPTTAVGCFDDPLCEDARTWQWDTTTTLNGPHRVTITASDRVGNQEVREFLVDLQRAADQAPRTSALRRTILGGVATGRVGASVAALGDVNGDGYADYAVGAPGISAFGRTAPGNAYLLLGSSSASTVDLATPGADVRFFLGPGNNRFCGTSVAAAGDVNGDGLNDILVGCPALDSTLGSLSPTSGKVYVVFGRTDPQNLDLANLGTAGFEISAPPDTAGIGIPLVVSRPAVFGERLSSATPGQSDRDLNDDGLDDIVIGDSAVARGADAAAGAAYVIYGKTTGTPVNTAGLGAGGYVIRGTGANSLTGYSAAITDDLTGDAASDIVIGAPGATPAAGGKVYVVDGAGLDTDGQPSNVDLDLAASGGRVTTLTSGSSGDRFGVSIAALGDTNLDGRHDVALGTSSGAYVLRALPTTSRAITIDDGYRVSGPANDPGLSTIVPEAPLSPAGDIDGDERADLVVGYPDTNAARAYVIRSPETARDINVAALPGQRGAAITTGTRAERSGAAVAANTYQGMTPVSENAQSIVGAPYTARDGLGINAGRAYILTEPTPAGPGVDPIPDPNPPNALGASGLSGLARSRQPLRSPVPGWYDIDVQPQTKWVTVRNDRQLFVIGSARDQVPFLVFRQGYGSGESGDTLRVYFHGRLWGDQTDGGGPNGVHRCGWVLADKAPPPGAAELPGNPFTVCGEDPRLSPNQFATLLNCDHCSDGSPVRLRRRGGGALPASIPTYRNVRPGRKEGRYSYDGNIPTSIETSPGVTERVTVNWRYITKSQKFVMVRASSRNINIFGPNHWVFIERKYLPHTYGKGGLCDNTESGPPRPAGADPAGEYDSERLDYRSARAQNYRRRQGRSDWPNVCSHRKYSVPDSDLDP